MKMQRTAAFFWAVLLVATMAMPGAAACLAGSAEDAVGQNDRNVPPSASALPLAVRIMNYGAHQDDAWTHLPSLGVKYLFLSAPAANDVPAVERRLNASGLRPLVLRSDVDLGRATSVPELAEQCAVCRRMGVHYLFLSPRHTGIGKQPAYRLLRQAGDAAKAQDVILVLETHPDLCANADMQRETMRRVDHPNVRVNFDTGNITFYNKGCNAVAELKKIIDYVATVELKDHNGRYMAWNFPVLGKGVVDFPAVLDVLRENRFRGPLTIEVEGVRGVEMTEDQTKQYIADSVRYVQSLLAKRNAPMRAGMIGLDTSHVVAFTKLLNDPKAAGELAELKIVAAYPGGSPDMPVSWNRVKGFTETLRGMGIEIVGSIDELLKRCDVVLLESVDGRPHLAQARQVIAAGKPLFIDKPLAASLADAMQILRLAEEKNVPCFSASSLRFSAAFQAARRGTAGFGDVRRCTARAPAGGKPFGIEPFWFHGIHGVEILFTIMKPGCDTVTWAEPAKVVGRWRDGREGLVVVGDEFGATIDGTTKSGDAGKAEDYVPLLREIVRFFKSGKSPVDPRETLEILAFMEAADQSKAQGGTPVKIEKIMRRAAE